MPGVPFGNQITMQGSGYNTDNQENPLFAQNPLVDSQEVLGGIKAPTNTAGLAAYASSGSGLFTLRAYSSIAYNTEDEEFQVWDGSEWEPFTDFISVTPLKIQITGGSQVATGLVSDDNNLLDADRIRIGAIDGSGIHVGLQNEVGDATVDTFRLELKNHNQFATEFDLTQYNGDTMRIPMWHAYDNADNTGTSPNEVPTNGFFRGSPMSVTSDGTTTTVTVSGGLSVTGTLTQGTNVSASSLDVTNRYIKTNDGYEAVDQTAAAAQGGFLVQVGVDNAGTPTAYYQRGIFWDAGDEHWRKAHFSSTSTAENAAYTEVGHSASTPNIPILELANSNQAYFTTSGDPYNYYYMTPSVMFTYQSFGTPGSDYDIDTNANTDISNQSITLDGTAVENVDGDVLIAGGSSLDTSFTTYNKVRTARIFSIRAIATDDNVSDKSIKVSLPDSIGYNDILMVSVYQISSGTHSNHQRQEIFGAEFIDGSAAAGQDGVFEVQMNQLAFVAGDVFDLVIVA